MQHFRENLTHSKIELKPVDFSVLFYQITISYKSTKCLYEILHIPQTLLRTLNCVQKLPRYKSVGKLTCIITCLIILPLQFVGKKKHTFSQMNKCSN